MERESVEYIIHELNRAGVRYLVVGGLAVVAHGYTRFTADVDLVLDLENENLQSAIRAFSDLGYQPRASITLEQFADAATRARWIAEKGLTVLSLFSPQHPWTEVDLFVNTPFDFDQAYAMAPRLELAPNLTATFVSLQDLLSGQTVTNSTFVIPGEWCETWNPESERHWKNMGSIAAFLDSGFRRIERERHRFPRFFTAAPLRHEGAGRTC